MDVIFSIDQIDFNKYYLITEGQVLRIAKYDGITTEKSLWMPDLSRPTSIGRLEKAYKKSFFSCIPFLITLFDSNRLNQTHVCVYQKVFPYPLYEFIYDSGLYRIYLHIGTKASIYLNQVQIGYYDMNAWKTGSTLNMRLVINKGIDVDLICLACLNVHSNFTNESRLSRNRASYNISFQYKRFNKDWLPND